MLHRFPVLPNLTPEEETLEALMKEHLLHLLEDAPNHKITFSQFMHECLYAPGLGYYSNPRITVGSQGDFTTAPELSPYFGGALANFIAVARAVVLQTSPDFTLLEFGAGTGKLALNLLTQLMHLKALPTRYLILEVSPYLKEQQQHLLKNNLPDYYHCIEWINDFPPQPFSGFVLANEVLDAMPVNLFQISSESQDENISTENKSMENNSIQVLEGLVTKDLKLVFEKPITERLVEKVNEINASLDEPLAHGYTSEINLNLSSWISSISQKLVCGGVILIDYGFDRHTYYLPERSEGTIQCHFRHHHYSDIFLLPGLQDMTAHVDFSDVIEIASNQGFELYHYGNMASSLLDMGLLDLVKDPTPKESQALNLLLAPHEMGELFKVMILTKKIASSHLISFNRDLIYQL